MARITLTHHWKFRRLARELGSRPLARGILELLWEAAYELADPYIGTPEDIAEAVGWTGPPTDLVRALVACGFLDDVGAQYVVHDLWIHAPDFVRLRWTRAHPGENRPWNVNTTSSVGRSPTSSLAKPSPVQEQRLTPRSVVDQRTDAGKPNPRVLAKIAHELDGEPFETLFDLKDAIKDLAVKYRLPYDGDSLGKALDILARSRRPPAVVPAFARSRGS